ncbi:MAG: hypothetical protein FGF48_10265 [Candidatus Brockarchaeota archaeon]|nr:hypothetical protein [Candidatus Brockarchaeota archaeon]
MNRERNRIAMGIILLAAGFLGLTVSLIGFAAWNYSAWPGTMHSTMGRGMMLMQMMEGWHREALVEIEGTVEKLEWMEIELKVEGGEVEVHGPTWFWQRIGIKEGDTVSTKGVFVLMMEPRKGWHEEFLPFELTINGMTYGNASRGVPVWMQVG